MSADIMHDYVCMCVCVWGGYLAEVQKFGEGGQIFSD